MSITAKIIADSINTSGDRLTTFIVEFPRIVLAEFNTHRVLSKNSASSRAIPFEKMLDMVKTNPFIPLRFQKEHKGMQGTEYYEGIEHDMCVQDWLKARDSAIESALNFRLPVTKQLRNRLLEAFMYHRVIVSGTCFENYFALRFHNDAEIHISKLAEQMLIEYNASSPKKLREGEWHIPFGDVFDEKKLAAMLVPPAMMSVDDGIRWNNELTDIKKKIAVARCARISYQNFEGKDDYAADIKLCDRLFGQNPKHLSPTEHVASAMSNSDSSGNFKGWKQFRKYFSDENLKDPRVIKK